jgi:nucleoid DNA-binding protein
MAGVNELSKLTGLKRQQILDVFDAVLNLVIAGERVIIRGFGSFWEVTRQRRIITSSALPNGEAVVPEAKTVRFRPAISTKRIVKARGKAKKAKK